MVNNATQNEIGLETARILFDIGAVKFNILEPFKLSSGITSPVYVDCRRIISYPKSRERIISFFQDIFMEKLRDAQIQNIAGGETAGIPFASILADRLNLPLCYVRKKPKGYGINSQIEGRIKENENILLVEDLATNGGSKIAFVDALRKNKAKCNNIFVVFYYNIFKGTDALLSQKNLNLHYLANWKDVLNYAKKNNYFDSEILLEVENFLSNPMQWSSERASD